MMLLVGAGLLMRSFQNLSVLHPGFDPTGTLSMTGPYRNFSSITSVSRRAQGHHRSSIAPAYQGTTLGCFGKRCLRYSPGF